jgi:hypothetical protein
MNNNVFKFGDLFFKQKNGTAMGFPPAPVYANLYFGAHEHDQLPKWEEFLDFYVRYIDDIFGIWRCHTDPIEDA